MNIHDLNEVIAEAERFLKKARILKDCTMSANDRKKGHQIKYGYDSGVCTVHNSRTRAAVKRSAIDLKNVLTICNK